MGKRRSESPPDESGRPHVRARLCHDPPGTLAVPHIDRLPHELLLEIFDLLANTSGHQCTGSNKMSPACVDAEQRSKHLPVLSGVCRAWRQIMIHTPKLWSTIALHVRDFDDYERLLARTRCFLERSEAETLNISVDMQYLIYGLDPPRTEALNVLLALLLQHTSRWRSFTMLTQDHSYFEGLLYPANSHSQPIVFSQLRSLTLKHIDQDFIFQDRPERHRTSIFARSALPVLDTLHLDGFIMPWSDLYSALSRSPPSCLQDLSMTCPESTDFSPPAETLLSILASTPSLRTLDLNLRVAPHFGHALPHPNLPNLQTLTIHHICPEEHESMLRLFTAPSIPCEITWKEVEPCNLYPPTPEPPKYGTPFHYPRWCPDEEVRQLETWDFGGEDELRDVEVQLAPPMELLAQEAGVVLMEPMMGSLVGSLLRSLVPSGR